MGKPRGRREKSVLHRERSRGPVPSLEGAASFAQTKARLLRKDGEGNRTETLRSRPTDGPVAQASRLSPIQSKPLPRLKPSLPWRDSRAREGDRDPPKNNNNKLRRPPRRRRGREVGKAAEA